ncbi:MAG: exodeoxyribonuclease VII large subunit [Acidimicrobiales bacterium]
MTLFDSGGAGDADGIRRVSLVRLSALIAQSVGSVGRVTVEGEVHRPQTGRTGRQWFTLRDRTSQISISVPSARRARCRIVAGERVAVTGRLEWVNDWGQLQLVAEEIVPVGEGAIAAMISEARERMRSDGLLDRPRRPIPRLPDGIGVICGHEAAVRADVESVVAVRFAGYPLTFVETTVSGPGAVDNVVAALADLDARRDIAVIIVARGGGDSTAMLPFSDESLCRAVCACVTPVVSAIGHEGDRPLLDEVADLRCGTPSLAAGAVVPDREALRSEIDGLLAHAAMSAAYRLTGAGQLLAGIDRGRAAVRGLDLGAARLEGAIAQLELVHPLRELDRARARLGRLDLVAPARARLDAASAALSAVGAQVEALSPVRVLERGYAVVRRPDGTVVRDATDLLVGAGVTITVARGLFAARVTDITDERSPE